MIGRHLWTFEKVFVYERKSQKISVFTAWALSLSPTSAPAFIFSFHLSSIKCRTDPFSQQTMSPPALALIVSLSVKSVFILICSKHTVINLKTDRETDIDWHRHQKTNAAELTQWMPTSESMLQKKREREESGPVSPPSACFSDVSVFRKQEGWF